MSLADLAARGLPLNRKERFYTGTVFPAIVCADKFEHFHLLGDLIDGCPPLTVDADPSSTNVQVFTEYGLLESIFGDATKERFQTPPEARDTPDILIFVASTPPVLIALEAKMYDRPRGPSAGGLGGGSHPGVRVLVGLSCARHPPKTRAALTTLLGDFEPKQHPRSSTTSKGFYNRRRRHSTLDYLSPTDLEHQYAVAPASRSHPMSTTRSSPTPTASGPWSPGGRWR